ncbi:MAG: radical SAM protein [Eubacteriales bacterium]|nr:radical SAM protein [Eubacteriales bacterium]MDD3881169.1 radical SAM protein [Eubacteriales bacterium]MDD4511551.1 radical SAM protein [Eubacteriales bacterium]
MLCSLCPRKCKVERSKESGSGFCKVGSDPVIAKCMIHRWEEPCLLSENGTGAVFFSSCTLGCVYCQNYDLSHGAFGKSVSAERLAEDIRRLVEEEKADSVDLVTGTQFLPAIIKALEIYRPPVPVIWNSGGYERTETLRALRGLVDIYLPDFKTLSPRLASLLMDAPDYPSAAESAIAEMVSQTGVPVYNGRGQMLSGTLIRLLVLPGCTGDACRVLDRIAERYEGIPVSLMGQYIPVRETGVKGLERRLTQKEYDRVLEHMLALGIGGYSQELTAADAKYTPVFDLSGV